MVIIIIIFLAKQAWLFFAACDSCFLEDRLILCELDEFVLPFVIRWQFSCNLKILI